MIHLGTTSTTVLSLVFVLFLFLLPRFLQAWLSDLGKQEFKCLLLEVQVQFLHVPVREWSLCYKNFQLNAAAGKNVVRSGGCTE